MSTGAPFADPRLPGLGTALDPDAVRDLIGGALPDAASTIARVTVADVRYVPGAWAEVLYRVKTTGPERKRSEALVRGRLEAGGRPAPAPAALVERYRGWQGRGTFTPELWLDGPGLALTAYPMDAELPTLFDALDPAAVGTALGELWRDRAARVRVVRIDRLGYTPHARAAFLYEVLATDDRGIPELRRLIAKLHATKNADRLFAGAWALWRATNGRCRLAPPVGQLPELRVTLQEQLRGERLGALAAAPGFNERVRETARALAALHDTRVPLLTRRKPSEEAKVLERWSGVLAAIRPDLRVRVERLRARLSGELERRVTMKGPVHGDFHHTNVLVASDGISIIDLDEMAWGDPLLDVGRFMASLRIPALRAFGRVDGLEDARGRFLDEYLRLRDDDAARARLFEAASLFTAAASSFRIQRPSWREEVEMLVEEAARVADLAGESVAVPGAPLDDPGPFPVVERAREWSADPVYMEALLGEPVRAAFGARMDRLSVHDARPGMLARYRVRGRRDGKRWKAELDALVLPAAGAATVRRMDALRAALDGVPAAPALPRVIAHIRPLGAIVIETPPGLSLASLLGTPRALAGVERFARALAVLHGARAELDQSRSWEVELERLARRVRRLRDLRPDLHDDALRLLDRVAARTRPGPPALTPALSTVRPSDVFLDEDRVALRVESPMLGPPAVDVADFLARLTLLELRPSAPAGLDEVGRRFVECYVEHGGEDVGHASPVHAAALLRLACTQAEKRGPPDLSRRLLGRAMALL